MKKCVFRYNGSKCPHPAYSGHDHCVFHLEEIRYKEVDFQLALDALVQSAEENHNAMLDMRGFVFPNVDFTDKVFNISLAFQASHFHGAILFSDSLFNQDVDFSECTFHNSVKFQNGRFQHDVSFRKSKFLDTCDFNSARFFSEASFSNVSFIGAANFRSVEFLEKASFRKGAFQGIVDFKQIESKKELDFKECSFSGDAEFSRARFDKFFSIRQCNFEKACWFKDTIFDGELSAENSRFRGSFHASGSVFRGKVDFSQSQFSEDLELSYSKFETVAQFNGANFDWRVILNSSSFDGRLSFHNCVFAGNLFARDCDFSQPCEFQGARFHNELDFSRSRFAYLKNVSTEKGIRLDYAILEDSHFWGTDVLNGYSFRNAFLLSLNLSNKQVKNCDFTGAVVSGVNTKNWQLDEVTKKNTKYVFSNYNSEIALEGTKQQVFYQYDEYSRVPADGNFGEGEHKNYSLEDYLKSLCVWSLSLQVPGMLRKAYLDYINFFSDYARATEMINVEIRTRREGRKLRVEFITEDETQKRKVEEEFPRYLANAKGDYQANLDFLIKDTDMSAEERDALKRDYDFEIKSLRERLDSKLELLEKESEKNAVLIEYLGQLKNNPPAITNLIEVKTEEPLCVVNIDIASYSRATKRESALYPAIQGLMGDLHNTLQREHDVEWIQDQGDGMKLIISSPEEAAFIADDVIHKIRKFNRQKGDHLQGVRAIVGYGLLFKQQRGEDKKYTGDAIVEIDRMDRGIKRYIAEYAADAEFALWCSHSYFDLMDGRAPRISFQPIGEIELDKGEGKRLAYRVFVN